MHQLVNVRPPSSTKAVKNLLHSRFVCVASGVSVAAATVAREIVIPGKTL